MRNVGTREELVARAKALVPILRERAAKTEELRELPEETIRDFTESGIARILQPSRFGGAESHFAGMVDILTTIGSACGSTGWVLGQHIIHNFMVSAWPKKGQDEVWTERPENLVSGILIAARGRATKVDGGYRLSGQWPFVSGVNTCDWCIFSAYVENEDSGALPEERMFLLPQGEFEILDTWYSLGLRGSGSNDVKVDNVLILEHRTLAIDDSKGGDSPGSAVNTAPLFKAPSYAMFGITQGSTSLGIAQGTFDTYTEQARGRIARISGKRVSDYTTTLVKISEAEASLDAARTILYSNCDQVMAVARTGRAPTIEQKTRFRRDGAFAGMLAMRASTLVFELSGGAALYDSNSVSRGYRDMLSAHAHISQNWDVNASTYGGVRLGLPCSDPTL